MERLLTLTASSECADSNVAENAMSCELSHLSKYNSTNISVLVCTSRVKLAGCQYFNLYVDTSSDVGIYTFHLLTGSYSRSSSRY